MQRGFWPSRTLAAVFAWVLFGFSGVTLLYAILILRIANAYLLDHVLLCLLGCLQTDILTISINWIFPVGIVATLLILLTAKKQKANYVGTSIIHIILNYMRNIFGVVRRVFLRQLVPRIFLLG
ncbi:MAG: hypothetical protein RRC34_13750 [Lentisphaeria bacterium]|nr:hypothetical protein [Lentisphaeria bacterium]